MTPEQNYLLAWIVWGVTTTAGMILGYMNGGIKGALGALVLAGTISSAVLAVSALRAAARRDGIDPSVDGGIVAWLRQASDLDIDGVKRKLSCAAVESAVAIGASRVRLGAFVVVLDGRRVVTIRMDEKRRLRPPRHSAARRTPSRRDRRSHLIFGVDT